MSRTTPVLQRVAGCCWAQRKHAGSRRSTRLPRFEPLEQRLVLGGSPLPTQLGMDFVLDDWDGKVTRADMVRNYFGGNSDMVSQPPYTSRFDTMVYPRLSRNTPEGAGNSLDVEFDFAVREAPEAFAGVVMSLFGETETKTVVQPGQSEPDATIRLPGYFLDFDNVFGDFRLWQGRSIESVVFDVRLADRSSAVTVKVELQDEQGIDAFTRLPITSTDWTTIVIPRSQFTGRLAAQNLGNFDWHQVSILSLLVEHQNVADQVSNPLAGGFLVDNLRLRDADGVYPNLDAAAAADGKLALQYRDAFLDYVRQLSLAYFTDFEARDLPALGLSAGGIVQDRSTFADVVTPAGAGFQLTAYVIDADRGYLERADAANRVLEILQVLDRQQGPEPVGRTGYQGFFYATLGLDGFRKQFFDVEDTPLVNESQTTVALSALDTAAAIAGVVTARQYFTASSTTEQQIRQLADEIYGRVNWPFMLADVPVLDPDGMPRPGKQFYVGWKPNETRDDESGRAGRYKIDDADRLGQYSSMTDSTGLELPVTMNSLTDEVLLTAILAMGSPNPQYRVDRTVWDSILRWGTPFAKSYAGTLETYQSLSLWIDTQQLGTDNYGQADQRLDLFHNAQQAIQATRDYAIANPHGRGTWRNEGGANLWGLSAAEDPFDNFVPYAAPTAAFAEFLAGRPLQAEDGQGDGLVSSRSMAQGQKTVRLTSGQTRTMSFNLAGQGSYFVEVGYSNDSPMGPPETVIVRIDGERSLTFEAENTRLPSDAPGTGWNHFVGSAPLGPVDLPPGPHQIDVTVSGGDPEGIEIDAIVLGSPLETGTVTNYAVASSILHEPSLAVDALWASARLARQIPGMPELLHPRFGLADAFNVEIADSAYPGSYDPDNVVRPDLRGPWSQMTSFATNQGAIAIMLDNYLANNFIPQLVMSEPGIHAALQELFPAFAGDSPWRNPNNPLNVNGDAQGAITPLDVLVIINELNGRHFSDPGTMALFLPPPPGSPPPYLDVDGNGLLTAIDALLVINYINAQASATGEGESLVRAVAPPAETDGKAAPLVTAADAADSIVGGARRVAASKRPDSGLCPLDDILLDIAECVMVRLAIFT